MPDNNRKDFKSVLDEFNEAIAHYYSLKDPEREVLDIYTPFNRAKAIHDLYVELNKYKGERNFNKIIDKATIEATVVLRDCQKMIMDTGDN